MLRTSRRYMGVAKATKSGLIRSKGRDQLMQDSPVPTDKFQRSLPRLPIPKLEDTVKRYIASQKALLHESDPGSLKKTEDAVRSFLTSDGVQLDKQLRDIDKANKDTSYISGPWTDMYLKDRRPVAFTHNPGLGLADDPRPAFAKDSNLRSANMLISALKFHNSLRANKLHPDVFHMQPGKTSNGKFWNRVSWMPGGIATQLAYLHKVFPLDMSQFPNLFQSTRIPTEERDVIRRFPDAKHMLIMCNGSFYAFDAYDKDGCLFEPAYYLEAILRVRSMSRSASKTHIGVLTTLDRDTWTHMRDHLVNLGNGQALDTIDSALFAICLDEWDFDEENPSAAVAELCCGSRPENRWFDKSFSLIFSNNGSVGINFEHAWGDGVAIMRFIDDMFGDSLANEYVTHDQVKCADEVNVREVTFTTDAKVEAAVRDAKKNHESKLAAVEFGFYHRPGFGKEDCKRKGVGPDALMQTAFQMAHRSLHGRFAPAYESCSTAIYRHGRTETVRPLTHDMAKCVRALQAQSQAGGSELLALLQQCSKTHMDMTRNAAQGQGWDRHLFALRVLAGRSNIPVPDIFTDPNYQNINGIVLSTSTLSSKNFGHGGFCPVIPNGYGLGYQIRHQDLGVSASTFKYANSSGEMCAALENAFDILARVVQK